MKEYMIVVYAYLVKAKKYDLEPVEGSTKPVVPTSTDVNQDYRTAVAEYLAKQAITA